jgi:hypothetical protein
MKDGLPREKKYRARRRIASVSRHQAKACLAAKKRSIRHVAASSEWHRGSTRHMAATKDQYQQGQRERISLKMAENGGNGAGGVSARAKGVIAEDVKRHRYIALAVAAISWRKVKRQWKRKKRVSTNIAGL